MSSQIVGSTPNGGKIRKVLSGVNIGGATPRVAKQSQSGRPTPIGLFMSGGEEWPVPGRGFLIFLPEHVEQSEEQEETGNMTLGSTYGAKQIRNADNELQTVKDAQGIDTHKVQFTATVYAADMASLAAKREARKAAKAA